MIKLSDIQIEQDLNKFPYLQSFIDKFNPPLDHVVFVHGKTLYMRNPKMLSFNVKVHELTHMRQQEALGLENWFSKYLSDDQKRLELELEAYKSERDCMRPSDWRKRLKQILPYLCGETYGNIINEEQALKLLI